MAELFDPYHKWLAIPPKDQPPNHYRLLGLDRFESDPDVIESAADQRMAHVRTFQTGQNSAVSQRILNELSAAKLCLLDPKKKPEYDRQLRQQVGGTERGSEGQREGATPGRGAVLPLPLGEGRGEGALRSSSPQPRAMPQAKPMPVVQPVPARQPLAAQSSPVIIADSASMPAIHQRRGRKKSSWAPAVLVAMALLAMAAVGYWLVTRSGPPTQLVATPSATKSENPPHSPPNPPAPSPQTPDERETNEQTPTRPATLSPDNSQSDSEIVDTIKVEQTPPAAEVPSVAQPVAPTAAIDLLKQIDVNRDAVAGEWQVEEGVLVSPNEPFSRLLLPPPPAPDYQLTVVGERVQGGWGLGVALVVGGHQTVAEIDGYNGHFTGLTALDGKTCNENETARQGRLLNNGQPATLVYTVRPNKIQVTLDGQTVIDWRGDSSRLSMIDGYKLPDQTRLALCEFKSICRISKIEIAPLTPEEPSSQVASMTSDKPQTGLLKIFEDEPEFVSALALSDNGSQIGLDSNEAYSGKASVKVTPSQRFAERLPGLNVKIRKNPTASDEYRYLRFAWKKRGGGQIWLQLHFPSNWHRYYAGPNHYGAWGGVGVADDLPTDFAVVTRDLAADFGEFTFNGLALTPFDGECAWFDHIYLARTLQDFDRIETSPRPRERKFSDLVMGNSPTSDARAPVPNDDEIKKARQEFQKKYSSQIGSARQPEQKRNLALDLIRKAETTGKVDAALYVLLRQASDLAEAAGDLDVAGQAADQLAKSFAVSAVALRQESLTEIAKGNKTPDQCRLLTDAACRLMVTALAAGEPAVVKKLASQATTFAKRTKDRGVQKVVTALTNDAGKLADEFEAVAAARQTLKSMPDDSKANQTVGHYELCAAGDWQNALPKLAKGDDASWKQLAADELALDYNQPIGVRRVRPIQQSTAERQLAIADGWWSKAEDEPWPGRHYLRIRAGVWYGRARSSTTANDRLRADQRLRMLMATDEGLPNLELLKIPNANEKVGDVVRVQGGWSVETPVDYDGPITVTLVVRTTGDKLHLNSHSHGWFWDFKIEPNRWHVMRYVITAPLRSVFANGMLVFTEKPQTSRTLGTGPVRIHADNNEVLEIKKFLIEPLN